jgi:hypothetical protein
MLVAQLFVEPWRLQRRLVLAQQLLQQRFVLEPFFLWHFRFWLA